MLDFVIFAVTFIVILIVLVILLYPTSRKVTTVPGLDPSTKEDGNLSDIIRAGSLHEFLVGLHKQYGPIASFWMGEQLIISIASPTLFKQHISVFDRPVDLFQILTPLCGPTSIKFLNGPEARNRHQLYNRSFHRENLHMYSDQLHKITNVMVTKWGTVVADEHIPLHQYMSAFATKAILQCIVGGYFFDDKEVLSFKHNFDHAWSELEHRLNDPSIPSDDSSRGKLFNEGLKEIKSLLRKAIEHREKHKIGSQEMLTVDHIMASHKDIEGRVDDCVAYAAAGIPTMTSLLTWSLYFLASHPLEQDKVHEELLRVFSAAGDISQYNVSQLKYLKQVLEETCRCAVIMPWTARYQDFDTEIGGHKIPKQTPVVHALGVVLQDEKLWPLPNKFDPDRFSVENSKERPSLSFSPFGFAGKRHCPAQEFVYYGAAIVIASLINKFKLNLVDGQVVTPVYGLVTHPEDEIWITVSKRK